MLGAALLGSGVIAVSPEDVPGLSRGGCVGCGAEAAGVAGTGFGSGGAETVLLD